MIENREGFLKNLALKLGRDTVKTECDPYPTPVNNYSAERFADLSRDELTAMFLEASKAMYAKVETTTEANLVNTVLALVEKYGSPCLVSRDDRLDQLGVTQAVCDKFQDARVFDKTKGDEFREFALHAKSSIVMADYGFADVGFVALHATDELARVVSLLPENSIILVRRSQILPRVAQFAKMLDERVAAGERLPSVINVIGGPSSTADIELVKCIGVHGPLVAHYVLIED